MQLSKSVISFLLGTVILSAIFGPFVAIAHRGLLTELTVDKTIITDEKFRSNVLRGQKMVFGDGGLEMIEAKDAPSVPSSDAKHSVKKCGHGVRKDESVNCHFRNRRELHPGDYFEGHIPYTADYHKPQHHHPKNN